MSLSMQLSNFSRCRYGGNHPVHSDTSILTSKLSQNTANRNRRIPSTTAVMQTPQLQQHSASAKYPKRRADAEMKTGRNKKKQNKAQDKDVSTKEFRAPSSWGMKQPIGITQAQI